MKIPNYKTRLQMIFFQMQFDSNYLDYDKNVIALKKAIELVRDRKDLKQVYTLILKIGNFLNQNDKMKGNKANFKPDLLTNLGLTKGVGQHNKSNMMDYLLKVILDK